MRNDSNKSSPLLGDDDESEQERRWVDEGSRRKIAAPRMQATSASPSPCAEISDGPSRAEHGDGVQRRTCVLAREHEASLWMRRRSKPAASISRSRMSRGHVLGPVSCQINWLQILRSSCKFPHRSPSGCFPSYWSLVSLPELEFLLISSVTLSPGFRHSG